MALVRGLRVPGPLPQGHRPHCCLPLPPAQAASLAANVAALEAAVRRLQDVAHADKLRALAEQVLAAVRAQDALS